MNPDIDPTRFPVEHASPRGFRQAYVRVNPGGVPLLCVHGWPESKRIFWKVIEPLAEAGFEVIVPDLRGFGDSEVGPDGFHDVTSHSHDLHTLVQDHLGHDSVVLVGGDLGGPVIQDLAMRFPHWVDRMVLFNSPLPYLKDRMANIAGTRPPRESADYYIRQGTDPDGLAAELTRRNSVSATSRRSTPAASGPIRERSPARARPSSTPSRSAGPRRCGPASARTRAHSALPLAPALR